MKKRMLSLLVVLALMMANLVPVSAKSITMLHDWDNIVELASIDREDTAPRITNTVGLTIGEKKYMYITLSHDSDNQNQSLIVYDITDLSAIQKVEKYTSIVTRIASDQIAVKDNYLFTVEKVGSANQLMRYEIGADGKLAGSGTKIADGSTGNKMDTVKIVDNYLFFAKQMTSGNCTVYDVSNIENGMPALGATTANYGVFAPGIEKISDSLYRLYYVTRTDLLVDGNKPGAGGYQYTITDMQVASDGSVSFTQCYQGIDGFENVSDFSAIKVNEVIGAHTAYIAFWSMTAGKYSRYIVDSSDPEHPVIQELSTTRALSVLNLNEGYYAAAENTLVELFDKTNHQAVKRISGLGGQVYDMFMYDGKLLIAAESKLHIYDLYAELCVNIDEIGEINDAIVNIDAEVKLAKGDKAILELFGEQIDVTEQIVNDRLHYSQNTTAADGDYTAKIAVVRGEEELLSEEKDFTIRKTKPVVITHSGLETGATTVSGTVQNTHSTATQAGTLYLAVYESTGTMQKVYTHPFEALMQGAEQEYSFTLEEAVADGQIVKLFAVDNDGKVLSDVVATGSQAFNTDSEKIPVAIDGKVNLYAEVDPATVVVKISGKSAEEAKQDVFVRVYRPVPDDQTLDYVNVFESNTDGSFYCEYPMLAGEEGENYTIYVAMSDAAVLLGTRPVSYYSTATISAALLAMQQATGETFDSIAIDDNAQYKNVYGLNTELYEQLEPAYKTAVAAAIAGKSYADIAALNTAFDEQVRLQKEQMDQDHAVKAALEQINTAPASEMEAILTANKTVLGLEFGALYEVLTDAMKLKLYENWLCGKSFTAKEAVMQAIKDGTAVEYVRQAQYGAVVQDQIIQNYGAEMGLNAQSVAQYAALSAANQQSVIMAFLNKNSETYASIATNFNAALQGYNYSRPVNGGGGGGGTGGGGVNLPAPIVQQPVTEVDPEDVIPSDVLELEKKNPFTDVSFDAWYFKAVCALAEKGIVEGITETEFMPDVNVKREEFVKMLVSAYNVVDYTAEAPFVDTEKNRWYYSYVATAYKLKLINGISADAFGTGLDITREDLAKIVYDAMKAMGEDISAANGAAYADQSNVSAYAVEGVSALSAAGILTGFEDNTFRPKDQVTRAMAAQVIYNVLNY